MPLNGTLYMLGSKFRLHSTYACIFKRFGLHNIRLQLLLLGNFKNISSSIIDHGKSNESVSFDFVRFCTKLFFRIDPQWKNSIWTSMQTFARHKRNGKIDNWLWPAHIWETHVFFKLIFFEFYVINQNGDFPEKAANPRSNRKW